MRIITKKQVKEIIDFKNRRLKLGLTLREVEEATGISNPHISQIENQTTESPSFYTVIKLHNYYRKMEINDKSKLSFEELNKYKNGRFFFKKGNKLSDVSGFVLNKSGGVYLIYKDRIDLIYIGYSGTISQKGVMSKQSLKGRINNKQGGVLRQKFFEKKMMDDKIEELEIVWYETFDQVHKDLPKYIEGVLINKFYQLKGCLPIWNKAF
ncbi:MAG TPA: helix-turn-helix transcriptional regulator [Bacteroidia bacterium]|nr:helix-turn-helix transcriptional regulator [Bacteroidia bacterium]